MSMNYSIILGNLGNTCDRFLSSGYKEELDKDTMLKQASQINRVKGIELVGTWDIDETNVREMKRKLDDLIAAHYNTAECGTTAAVSHNVIRNGNGTGFGAI